MECLSLVIETSTAEPLPTLVLNGDVLDFALATDDVAAMAFERFIDLAFDRRAPMFDPVVYYVPGNHDHHLWETARERQYSDYVRSVPPDVVLGPAWHVTRMFEQSTTVGAPGDTLPTAELLNAIVYRRRQDDSVQVKVAYPNLGVVSPDGSAVLAFHHGHFIESMYLLMTELRLALFPASKRGANVWDWEADNFAWIDFFWSTLGRSGQSGTDVGAIYEMLQSPKALKWLAGNLGEAISHHVPGPRALGRVLSPAIKRLLVSIAGSASQLERHTPKVTLSRDATAGLTRYLSGPLLAQIEGEMAGGSERKVSLVFGHTHKPFERIETVAGFAQPVQLFNTGGWVVDTAATNPFQGAAVVLVDDACNVASIRLYNQADERAGYAASLSPTLTSAPNPLHEDLSRSLDFSAEPWASFSAAVADGVTQRHQTLARMIAQAMSTPKAPSA